MPDPQPTADAGDCPSFEVALAQLETIMEELEEGNLGLADALARYEQGIGLLRQCHALLEHAERRIEILTGLAADGRPVTQPFDDQAAMSLEEKAQARSQRRSHPEPRPKPSRGDMDEIQSLF